MAVAQLEKDAVRLIPDLLNMVEERDGIPIYTITDWTFNYSNASNPNEGGIVVAIHLRRRILSELMTTYFPTILLVAITAATTHSWKKLEPREKWKNLSFFQYSNIF